MIFNLYEIKVMIIVVKKNSKKMSNASISFWSKARTEKRMSVVGKAKNDENVNISTRFWFIISSSDISPSPLKPMRPILVNSLSVSGVSKFFFVVVVCGNETENFSKIETYCVPLEFALALLYLKAGYCMHARSTTRRYSIYLLTAEISK